MGGPLSLQAKTIAELQAITPAVGDMYKCTNCLVPYSTAVGTAASPGAFGILPPQTFQ